MLPPVPGRLAQRESASFTPRRSLVRSQYRPRAGFACLLAFGQLRRGPRYLPGAEPPDPATGGYGWDFQLRPRRAEPPGPPQLVVAVWDPVLLVDGFRFRSWWLRLEVAFLPLGLRPTAVGAVVLARGASTPGAPAIHGTGCGSASARVGHPASGALRANRRELQYAQVSSKPPGAPDPAASPAVVEQYRSLIIRTLSYRARMTPAPRSRPGSPVRDVLASG